jgi:hypothetical protein
VSVALGIILGSIARINLHHEEFSFHSILVLKWFEEHIFSMFSMSPTATDIRQQTSGKHGSVCVPYPRASSFLFLIDDSNLIW